MKNNIKLLVILPVMLLASIFAVPSAVHAATGTVCAAPGGATNCSVSSLTATIGSTIGIAIVISGSNTFDTYDVTVLADHTLLTPVSVSDTGSVLGSGTSSVFCIQGVGPRCSVTDTIDTVHVIGSGTPTSAGGLLFTVNYKVIASTAGTTIGFQVGCIGSQSVSGGCINIVSAGVTQPEMAQSATLATPDFLISASPNPVFVVPSTTTTGTSTLTLTAVGGYGDFVNLAVTKSNIANSLSTSQVDLESFTTNTATLTVGPAAAGTYFVEVTAMGSGTFTTVIPTHAINVTVDVASPDFSVSANPSSLSIPHGSSDVSTVTVNSLGGYSGSVTVTASAPTGLTAMPSSTSVTAGNSYTLTIAVGSAVAPGVYTVNLSGSGTVGTSTVTHTASIQVSVGSPNFAITIVPGNIGVFREGSAAATINVQSLNNFAGVVNLAISITNTTVPDSAGSLSVPTTISPGSVTLTAGSTASSTLIVFAPLSVATAFYLGTVTGTSGTATSIGTATIEVEDYALSVASPSLTITTQTGVVSQDIVMATALSGFNSQGAAAVSAIPSGWYPGIPAIPIRRTSVPELGTSLCLLDTFYANGTQIPFSTLRLTGPIAWVGITARCGRNDGFAFPTPGAPDFFTDVNGVQGIQVQALSTTAPGTYTIKLITFYGFVTHSITITLVVVKAAVTHQLVFTHTLSLSASGGVQSFKLGVTNPDVNTVFAQVTVTAIGSAGHTFTATTGVFKINPNANANNIQLSITLTGVKPGETFTFSTSIAEGLTATALTGVSTQQSVSGVFTTIA